MSEQNESEDAAPNDGHADEHHGIPGSLRTVRDRIEAALNASGRSADACRLIAVSKGHPVDAARKALEAGQELLGESYVQEWQAKAGLRTEAGAIPQWHFIGGLQSNKIRYLVDNVHLIHGVDRASLIKEIRKRATSPQRMLIQVNCAGEASKSGCTPEALDGLVERAVASENVVLAGLMTIPPNGTAEESRRYFAQLRELFETVREQLTPADAAQFTELSMGMSGDFEVAIAEGATLVRVGTAIFGERDYSR